VTGTLSSFCFDQGTSTQASQPSSHPKHISII